MAAMKAGDRVKIIAREVTAEDVKTSLYFSYFGDLCGSVDRVYDDGSVCVEIDLDSLNDDTRERHIEMQENERKRWLENLSDEARNRLTAAQKQFSMSYKLLVSGKDLVPDKGPKPGAKSTAKAAKSEPAASESDQQGPEGAPAEPAAAGEAPKRVSEADLAAAEEAFLRSQQQK